MGVLAIDGNRGVDGGLCTCDHNTEDLARDDDVLGGGRQGPDAGSRGASLDLVLHSHEGIVDLFTGGSNSGFLGMHDSGLSKADSVTGLGSRGTGGSNSGSLGTTTAGVRPTAARAWAAGRQRLGHKQPWQNSPSIQHHVHNRKRCLGPSMQQRRRHPR
jgi:hypothetical protein